MEFDVDGLGWRMLRGGTRDDGEAGGGGDDAGGAAFVAEVEA